VLSWCRFRAAEYRRPLVLQEVLGFNADIICLQEVDVKAFQQFLQPHMDYAGTAPPPTPLCLMYTFP